MTKAAAPERDFKGIWIPKEVWLTEELTLQEKVFLVEIDSLDNEDGCWASNKYFAEFFNVTTQRASQVINSLKDKGFLTISYIRAKNSTNIERRIIRANLSRIFDRGIKKTLRGYQENFKGVSNIFEGGYQEKFKENNTSLNNTINNTINKSTKLQSEKMTGKEVVVNKEFKDLLLEEWNSIRAIPDIKALRHSTKRYDSLKARLEEFSEGEIIQAVRNIKNSDFLQGKNNRGWTITFDWFVKPNNFIKVLENQYETKESTISDLGIDESQYTEGQLIDIRNAAAAAAAYDEEEAYIIELMKRS